MCPLSPPRKQSSLFMQEPVRKKYAGRKDGLRLLEDECTRVRRVVAKLSKDLEKLRSIIL
jgi:hypothetical protein